MSPTGLPTNSELWLTPLPVPDSTSELRAFMPSVPRGSRERSPRLTTFILPSRAVMHGAVTYGGAGLGTAVLASVAMQRAGVRAYRGLTLPFKAFAITSATTAAFIIGADAASRKFELAKYSIDSDSKKTQLSRQAYQASELELATGISDRVATIDTSTLSTKQAVLEWGKEHRYSVVFGGCVFLFASCGAGGGGELRGVLGANGASLIPDGLLPWSGPLPISPRHHYRSRKSSSRFVRSVF